MHSPHCTLQGGIRAAEVRQAARPGTEYTGTRRC